MELEKLLLNDKITANNVSNDVDGETNWPFLKFELADSTDAPSRWI